MKMIVFNNTHKSNYYQYQRYIKQTSTFRPFKEYQNNSLVIRAIYDTNHSISLNFFNGDALKLHYPNWKIFLSYMGQLHIVTFFFSK